MGKSYRELGKSNFFDEKKPKKPASNKILGRSYGFVIVDELAEDRYAHVRVKGQNAAHRRK